MKAINSTPHLFPLLFNLLTADDRNFRYWSSVAQLQIIENSVAVKGLILNHHAILSPFKCAAKV